MLDTVREMLASKKFLAALLALVAHATARFGFNVNTEEVLPLVAPLWAYVLGQGIADHGKEAAKIVAESQKIAA